MASELQVFLNPGAGTGGDATRNHVVRAFESAGVHVRIHALKGEAMIPALRQAVANGTVAVGIAGGDGTISRAANVIANTATALLPIPLGTLNHFSKRYGIATIDAAVRAFAESAPRTINVGSVNDRIFVNNASVGFYPHVVRHRERLEHYMPRMAAMWLAGIRVLLELPMVRIDIEAPGANRSLRTPALWVGIGRNSLRFPVDEESAGREAVLEAVSGRAHTRRAVVALSLRLLRHLKHGIKPGDGDLDVVHARRFTLYANRTVDIALDGEPLKLKDPLRFALLENALRVFCLVDTAG